jgi:molybdopterin molybdotransferase
MAELDVSDLIGVNEAMSIIDGVQVQPRAIHVPLDQSQGLFLAQELRSDRDSPPFDKAQMDGYAVRAADVTNVPRELAIAETVPAGTSAGSSLQPGQAIAIMTGAPIPSGADAVIPVEQTEKVAGNRVVVKTTTAVGRFIAPRGSDAKANTVVLPSGSRIGPAQIAVAASTGATNLLVNVAPSVGVLGTGDELVPSDQTPTGPQIRSSNNAMLIALLKRFPCTATDLGIVRDDPALIEKSIRSGLSHDVLLITGGMSMGERDFVPTILRQLGGELKITKLRFKPGKPFVFAVLPGGKFVFGLPGNPVSAFVCTLCLVSRLLTRMAGGPPATPTHLAPLSKPLPVNGPRAFFQPAIFDGRTIKPLDWKGSADIFTLSQANSLLIRPENQPQLNAGEMVEFLSL